jgi:hypothetical protein
MDGDQPQVVDKDGERGRNRTFNLLIKSTCGTENQHFSAVCMDSDSLVKMRVSALRPNLELNASKRPLGTILGTVFERGFRCRRKNSLTAFRADGIERRPHFFEIDLARSGPDSWNDRGDERTLAGQMNEELAPHGLEFIKAKNDRAGGAQLIYTMLQNYQLKIAHTFGRLRFRTHHLKAAS